MTNSRKKGADSAVTEPAETRRAGVPRPVGAVRRAVSILRHLSGTANPEGATQIARAVDMYPGTCYQVLRQLVRDGLLDFDATAKTYRLARGVNGLVPGETERGDLKVSRRTVVGALSRECRSTTYLIGRIGEDRGVLIEFAHPEDAKPPALLLSFDTILVGAIGRISAYMLKPPRAALRELFERMPWAHPPAFKTWHSEVEAVGRLGYAVDRGHQTVGLTVVAAPIVDSLGRLSCFLATMYPEREVDEQRVQSVARATRVAAERIRHEMAMHALFGALPSG